ncbi:hypothetical protein NGI46_17505 [Peribacillus butanolivorans]|nr:hypothetical protein [Peribacillus butanolivorans]MCO0599209.1 hypothetical protein [Peribacillus butanolivorans]
MDKEAQEKFFQILKNTYNTTTNEENISIDEFIGQIKNELTSLYPKLH